MTSSTYKIEYRKGRFGFHVADVTARNDKSIGQHTFVRFSKERALKAAKKWCNKHEASMWVDVFEHEVTLEDVGEELPDQNATSWQ